ncbi:MAG: phosphotransferase [Actinobacteria bacterium]|nr:phosphotransferase [Actinomycetota bacterium]MCB8997177.1 phosphotransferase [Actinomycetota bacterium]MCB9425212.1 phosphotransferase [Actinomycetota bacterium]HRY10064.1 aminoglycoside phosphotransferase family protein [Candidatus Nanopelagicales bacterium]
MNRAELGEPFATGRSAEIFTWPENDWVLKLFEPDYPSESADLEQQSIDEALRLGVPTIAGHGRVEVDGRPGLLLDRVRGDSLTKQAERNPLKIRSGARALATTHVLVHESPTAEFTEIREATIAALDTAPMAFLDQAQKAKAAALIGGLPPGDRMLHLDFHTENVFIAGDAYTILDWQTTLRGDPAADVAMTVLLIRDAELWPGTPLLKRILVQRIRGVVLSTHLTQYKDLTGLSDAAIDAWRLPVLVLRMSTLDIDSERDRMQAEVREILAVTP